MTQRLSLCIFSLCLLTVGHATAAEDPLGGVKLLPGYTHQPLRGIDSIVGQIVKKDGLTISYEIGHISKPGEPRTGGGFTDRPKLTPKNRISWYREQQVNDQPVHLAYLKDKTLLVSFPEKGMNFRATINSSEDLADAMLMILTYPASANESDQSKQQAMLMKELRNAPTAITIDNNELVLWAEGINNVMPTIGPPGPSRIYFVVRLKTKDGSAMPKGLSFVSVYGIQGDKIWETQKFDGPRTHNPVSTEIVPRNAPVWTISAPIDMIVKVTDSKKQSQLIRVTNVGTMTVH